MENLDEITLNEKQCKELQLDPSDVNAIRFRKNMSVWISREGVVIKEDNNKFVRVPTFLSQNGYLMISKKYLDSEKDHYLHRMVVYTYGDKNGCAFTNKGFKNVIDHVDMNHLNCAVDNLELVSEGINLFRAYYKASFPGSEAEQRFKEYYNSLSEIDKFILKCEIENDIKK